MGNRSFGSSDHNWVEAADIWGWSCFGMHCLLLEEDIAWEEGLHIARHHRCFGRQALGCSTSLLLHPFFAPFKILKQCGFGVVR